MKIEVLHGLEGAKNSEGLTVIIDVFRAFTTSCYIMANGANLILATGSLDLAYELKQNDKNRILIGERNGLKCKDFDYGNSPAEIDNADLIGKEIIMTTSAGTQGLISATNSDEVITGSFVNAGAIVHYIKQKNPAVLSLVPLGVAGKDKAEEDLVCAEFIIDMLNDYYRCIKKYQFRVLYHYKDILKQRIEQGSWNENDLKYCLDFNHFSFILKSKKLTDDCVVLTKHNIWY